MLSDQQSTPIRSPTGARWAPSCVRSTGRRRHSARRALVAGAPNDGRAAAAQPFRRCCSGGDRSSSSSTTMPTGRCWATSTRGPWASEPAECWAEIWHIIGPMVGGAVPRRAGARQRRPRPVHRAQGLPRRDALQGRLQPGPRRDGGRPVSAACSRRWRRRRSRCTRERQLRTLRELGAARGRRADARAGVRHGGGDAAAGTRATFRSPSSTCWIDAGPHGAPRGRLAASASAGDAAPPTVALDAPGAVAAGGDRAERASVERRRRTCAELCSLPSGADAGRSRPHTAIVLPLAAPDQPRPTAC